MWKTPKCSPKIVSLSRSWSRFWMLQHYRQQARLPKSEKKADTKSEQRLAFSAAAEREMVPKCHREANNILGYDTKLKSITNIDMTRTFELPDRDSISVGSDLTARLRQRRVGGWLSRCR